MQEGYSFLGFKLFRVGQALKIALFLVLAGSISAFGQLSGTKTIGAGGDYATLTLAVAALNTQGVGAGGVTFNVKSGTYNEQIRIGPITGASASNQVVFQSQVDNADSVTIFFAATGVANNYVVKLDSADYVTFRKLKFNATGTNYASVFHLLGGADNISIKDNKISGAATGSSSVNYHLIRSDNSSDNNCEISGNTLNNGGWGIVLVGVSNANQSQGNKILNNTLNTGYGGVYLQYQDSPKVNGNTVNTTQYGIQVYDCDDSVRVEKNKVSIPANGWGILLQYCDGSQFGGQGHVNNNFVSVGGNSTAEGIYLESCVWHHLYYNSVNITSTYVGGRAFVANNGNNLRIRNNIFANTGGGLAYYCNTPAAITNSNYNNLYSPGSYLAYWVGDRKDLAAFKTASSTDSNSIFIYPQFLSSTDLHQASPWIDSMGTPVGSITTDIDGDPRDVSKPDIGADEFVAAPSSLTPLAGTYTIGTGGSYTTFTAAVTDLILKGVSAPVTFDFLPGNYNERALIHNISGASASNTITFQSQTLTPGDVSLFKEALNAGENYLVRLYGADFVTFQYLGLFATGSSYARVFDLVGGVDGAKILNNTLSGFSTGSNSPNYSLIYSDNYFHSNIEISGNSLVNGSWGVHLYGLSSTVMSSGVRVLNNTFATGYGGVYLQYQGSPRSNDNVITSSQYGIYYYDCDDSVQIQRNKVNIPPNGYGITEYYCDGTQFGGQGFIVNNFVTCGGTSTAYGFLFESCTWQNIYYNSVNVTSTYVGGIAFYANSGSNLKVKNNIFANTGGGYAYYCNTPSAIANSNYNDLYSPGNYLAYWAGGNRKDLAAFKSASSKDTNSVNIYPIYLSSIDLHQSSPWIDSAGTFISSVTTDVDGESRNASKPDIGADEFDAAPASLTPLSGTYSIGFLKAASPTADYATLTEAVNDVILKGVSGPVIFNLQAGVYNEQVSLVTIPGATSANTVTFQSETGNRGDVTVYWSASGTGDNHVFKLNGVDYIIIQKLTLQAVGASYARTVEFYGGCDNDKILNNALVGIVTGSSSGNLSQIYGDNCYTSNIQISANLFSDGGWGIILNGVGNAVQSTGTKVLNDTFATGYGGIYLSYHDSPWANSNVVSSNTKGIEYYDCDDSLQIQKNKVSLNAPGYGLLLSYCDGSQLGGKGMITNNFVSIPGNSTANGIHLETSTYQNVYYNSINIYSSYTVTTPFYVNAGNNINVRNNLFANNGGGYATYINTPAAIATSNYNNYYTPGNYLAYYNGNRRDFALFQTVSGKDTNSVSIYPVFVSNTDLHLASPWLDSAAIPITGGVFGVSQDIDNQSRDGSKPDIGADEFVAAPSSLTPLAGVYSVGSALAASPNADYPSLNAAVSDLVLRGVSGPVTFNVQSGVYSEHISIPSVPGANLAYPVIFQSLSGNAADVTITYSASTAGDNYVVDLRGCEYITLQKLTLQATGTSYATTCNLYGSIDNVGILNNRLIGYLNSGGGINQALVGSSDCLALNTAVSGNKGSNGGWGVYMTGINNSNPMIGTRVENDSFNTSYGGVYLQYNNSPWINGNVIASYYRGVELYDCDDSLLIEKNKINLTNPGYGIVFNYCDGTQTGNRGLTTNNFVTIGSTSTAVGLYLETSTYQNLYYNSVNITSAYTGGIAAYLNSGNNLHVVDNILANPGGGYSFYVNTPSAIVTSNYNDFYTTGSNLAYWNGNQTDLTALKTASGKDLNSISANPNFFTATDLHAGDTLLDSVGTPLALVSDDIDGEPRDATYPDIGADEFTCVSMPGDLNNSGTISLGDVVHLLNYLFDRNKPPCVGTDPGNCWSFVPSCRGDVNRSGTLTLGDVIHILNYLFDRDRPPCVGIDPGNCWTPEASGTCCLPAP